MNIAIIEILALEGCRWIDHLYNLLITRQFTSIMPQVVAVWCRQLGHRVHYASYYGFGDPIELIPTDAEIVFFACYTQASPLAYALSKILRSRGVRTPKPSQAMPGDSLIAPSGSATRTWLSPSSPETILLARSPAATQSRSFRPSKNAGQR